MESEIIHDIKALALQTYKVFNQQEVLILLFTYICFIVYRSGIIAKLNPIKLYAQMKLYSKLRNVLAIARSFNHRQTLLVKYILGLQIKENEDEVTSFGDIMKHYGKEFPFFMS